MPSLKALLFLSLLLLALTLGLAFCHVMEISGKFRLDGPDWLRVQQNLYVAFGPPVGAGIEVVAIALTWFTAISTRSRRPAAFGWTVASGVAVTAGLALGGRVVAPVSTALDAWTAATLPPDWTARRLRWEVGHAMHALCLAIGLEALLWAALAETPSG